ncbi:hypothetical protein YTPLAS18_28250 [Nitrospira sp.]|nr:hypothetical protein YTPLAS18_28250 [Nitrospira sp.]
MSIAYVSYYDNINEQKAKSLMQACAQVLTQTNATKLYFLFSSTGGSVDAGITLHNYLRALPVPLVMHNIGSIDSIANVVFLAADERYANENSTFLFHGIQWGFGQGVQLSWSQLQETVSRFKGDEGKIASIVSQRTKITEDELRGLFHQGEAKGTDFAKAKDIIQAVTEAKVPPGAPFFALNFS